MFKNYLKIAIRNLKRYKGFSLINIAGLATGMACCILILLWVQNEISYDRFHKNADRLFRVADREKYTNDEEIIFTQNPALLTPILQREYPEIINVCRLRGISGVTFQHGKNRFNEDKIAFVDPSLLEMFTFPLLKGDSKTALTNPRTVAITEDMSKKYFGDDNPVGKLLKVDNRMDFLITGVVKNIPSNSHLKFDFFVNFQTIKEFGYDIETWRSWAHTTYVLLDENADYHQVSQKIAGVIQKHTGNEFITLSLQPVPDIHLRSGKMWGIGGTGDIKYVYIFSIIAGFILLLACINFMNLSTARAANRAKEVGLRKVVGANRREIIIQFFGESIFYAFISLLFAVVLVSQFLPFFNSISGKDLVLDFQQNLNLILLLLGIAVFTGILSGSYPALFLSAFLPARVLKGTVRMGTKGSFFRKFLVTFQFSLTIILIICTLVVNDQLGFIRNQKLGFEKDQILSIQFQGKLYQKLDLLKSEFKKNQGVINVCGVSSPPAEIKHSFALDDWEGRNSDDQFLMYLLSADHDFANTLQIEMTDGRYFSREFTADTLEGIIVNEAAVRQMGMESPIGKKISGNKILGVIKDFHFSSLHSKIGPLMIYFAPDEIKGLLVKVNAANLNATIRALEDSWNRVAPEFPFEYKFLDEQIDQLYKAEQRVEKVINVFTLLALFIACLGLFGLASFAAEQRTKEIGVRKVLGATVTGLVFLLSREFTKYVLYASLIAWPLAFYAMNKWLQTFAYHISISWLTFALGGGLALIVALVTVSWQAVRAAIANPVKALRCE